MFRHRFTLDLHRVRDVLEELVGAARQAYARRILPLVVAEIAEVANLLRPLAHAFRRASSSLEDTELPPDSVPAVRPGIQARHRAAVVGHYGALLPDFALGLVVSRVLFLLSWLWSFGVGLFFIALALLSRLVAAVFLDRRDPARHVRPALILVLVGWLVLLLAMLLAYLVRGGVLPLGLVAVLIPVIWVAFLCQSVGFGVLAEAYAYPMKLYERYRELVARKAELEALRSQLEAELPPEGDADSTSPAPGPADHGNGRHGYAGIGSRRRGASRTSRVLGIAAVLGAFALGAPAHSASPPGDSISRLSIALDESPTGEDTQEFIRVRHALAEGLSELAAALPRLRSIAVLHWSDAPSVWAAGRIFALPHETRAVPLEAHLDVFSHALTLLQADDEARDRVLQAPVLTEVRRELLSRPSAIAKQSCVTQLVARAVDAPANELWVVLSDLEDFRCPAASDHAPGGAQVRIVAIPQRQGAETRQRMAERIEQLQRRFPGLTFVTSWEIDEPGSVRRLLVPTASPTGIGGGR